MVIFRAVIESNSDGDLSWDVNFRTHPNLKTNDTEINCIYSIVQNFANTLKKVKAVSKAVSSETLTTE